MLFTLAQVTPAALVLFLLKRRLAPQSVFARVPGPARRSWWKGCFYQAFDVYGWQFHHDIIEKYGSVEKLPSLFGYDDLCVCDSLALHYIIVKDQYVYEETSMFITSNVLFLGVGLLSTLGDYHRRQREMLNPVFSLKHMRGLLPVFYPIAYDLRSVLLEQVRGGEREIDILHWLSRAALEFIGQGGLGYSFDALHGEEANKYGSYIRKLGPLAFKTLFHRQFLPWIVKIGSPEFRRKAIELVPSKLARGSVEVVDALDIQAKTVYQEKKRALENGDEATRRKTGMGKDTLSVLLKANTEASESDRLPEEAVVGQLNTFIFAGQETTSHAITRALHLLSLNPGVQGRLRNEIVLARRNCGGADFDYDTLMELPYLDAICRETLRMFPPLSMVTRTTKKDVVLPLAWPILGAHGKTEITGIPIKKNTNIIVSIIGANRSRRIWGEDAEEWNPERWLRPLPESVAKAHLPGIYSSMMTFLGGGRACIGFKFTEMEMKLVLATLLETFEFKPGPEVVWQMSGISRPVLKHSRDNIPELPLRMSLCKVEK